jgi:hypothetical protein
MCVSVVSLWGLPPSRESLGGKRRMSFDGLKFRYDQVRWVKRMSRVNTCADHGLSRSI